MILDVDKISRSYGKTTVLNELSLQLQKGEFGCILGSSGSGKSTLLRIIAGLDSPDSGSVVVNGKTLTGKGVFVKPEHRSVGMIFQDYALFPHLSIRKNIQFGSKLNSELLIDKLIDVLGLKTLLERYPHEISGGQQQRVAIARSLAVQPDLLLMDEPFSNLDEWMKEEVRDELKTILRDLNANVLFVTHHANDALSFGDKIMVMDKGRIIQSGNAKSIIDEPINSGIAGIFGKVNLLNEIELKQLFGITKNSGSYFIRPGDFSLASDGTSMTVTECVYHGDYFDVNLSKDSFKLHVHLPNEVQKGSQINISPRTDKIFIEQQ